MTKPKTPIGAIDLVGAVAVQLYSRTYYGRTEHFAEIGKPWTNPQNGVTKIIPQMKQSATRDYVAAAIHAAVRLENLQRTGGVQAAATGAPSGPLPERTAGHDPPPAGRLLNPESD